MQTRYRIPAARLRQTLQSLVAGGDLPAGVVGELDRSIGDVCEIGEYGGLNSNEDKASMLVIYKWHIMVLAEMY